MFSCRVVQVAFVALATVFSGCATLPPTNPPSVWNHLGVPQVWNAATGHLINRNGGRPNRELKPPLKRIADPANLESDIPAIKEAAKIKVAEDKKKQKIKAVRYLAETVGCGCYDSSGEITDALVASLDDCTEDVRYATVQALLERAKQNRKHGSCSKCNGGCCNEDLLNKLSEIAYERKDNGCCVEPSIRVRQTAKEVLQLCCPQTCQPYYESYDFAPAEEPPAIAPPVVPNPNPPPVINLEGPEDVETETPIGLPVPEDSELQVGLPPTISPVGYQARQQPVSESPACGKVEMVSAEENGAVVVLTSETVIPIGTRCLLKRRNNLGRIDTLGLVNVVETEAGAVAIEPLGTLSINRIKTGDFLVLSE